MNILSKVKERMKMMDQEKINNEQKTVLLSENEENELFEATELLDKLAVLQDEYPELDIEALAEDEGFLAFTKDKGDDYPRLYEDYKKFEDFMYKRAEKRYRAKLDRITSGNSYRKPSNFGLSAAQLELLAEWNRESPEYSFSPREYSNAIKR